MSRRGSLKKLYHFTVRIRSSAPSKYRVIQTFGVELSQSCVDNESKD